MILKVLIIQENLIKSSQLNDQFIFLFYVFVLVLAPDSEVLSISIKFKTLMEVKTIR